MATVRLGRNQCENGQLPLVCMRCGAAAEDLVRQTFIWQPSWILLAVILGFLPYLVLAFILERRMTIQAPLCYEHRRHWANRSLLNFLMGFVFFGSLVFLLLLVNANALARQLQDQVMNFLCLGVSLAALVWAIAATVWEFRLIRAQRIDDHSITLKGVSPAFAAAVQAQT
jgi:hypothetical protein